MENTVTKFDNQIYVAHNNYVSNGAPVFSNNASPVMSSMNTGDVSKNKGKWIHVEVYYEVLERDENGLVTKVLQSSSATNGPAPGFTAPDEATGAYNSGATASYFKIFNTEKGTADLPEVGDLVKYRIQLNNAAYGDVRFDNVSFKLINRADK